MDEEEQALADSIYAAIQDASHGSVRSQQAMQFKVGVSDLGFCPERTRRMLDGQTPDRTDVLLAFLGTAIGDHVEQAFKSAHPEALIQTALEVPLDLVVDSRPIRIMLPGHPDILLREGVVVDVKTDYLLADAEKNGASKQQRFQRHLYGYGAWVAGWFNDDINLGDVRVGNCWVDRSGQDKRVHVELEPLSIEVVEEAGEWLEDVIYHQVHHEEARKVPPRDMCFAVCGFAADCRGSDLEVEGTIHDEEVVNAVRMYREGLVMAAAGERLKKAAKVKMDRVSGVVDLGDKKYELGWTWVDPTIVQEFTKRGYDKISLREVKAPKGKRL